MDEGFEEYELRIIVLDVVLICPCRFPYLDVIFECKLYDRVILVL